MVALTGAFMPLARSPGSPVNRKSDIKQQAGQICSTEKLRVTMSIKALIKTWFKAGYMWQRAHDQFPQV